MQDSMEMAIKACLKTKTHPIDPVDLIDDFEVGAAAIKERRLRSAIWKQLGEDIRGGILRLVRKREVVFTDDKKLVLAEIHEAIKRNAVMKSESYNQS